MIGDESTMKYESYEMDIILYDGKDVDVVASNQYGGGGSYDQWSIRPDRTDS